MRQRSQPGTTGFLLCAAGASGLSKLGGQLEPVEYLFLPKKDQAVARASATRDSVLGDCLACLPLTHLVALQFAFHDMAKLVSYGPFEQVFFDCVSPKRSVLPVANLTSGRIDLSSVYGNTTVTGDISQIFSRCLRLTWDRAKLWTTTGAPYQRDSGDVLRLSRVVAGDGAILSESFFEQLEDHLKPDFFEDGELRLNRAMIPEQRNDQSLLLSQFHFAVARFHNHVVDRLDARTGKSPDREAMFQLAKAATCEAFQLAILADVLPMICDMDVLDMCRARVLEKARSRADRDAVPVEGAVVISALLDRYPWPRYAPNPHAASKQRYLGYADQARAHGLPCGVFNSHLLPTRLSEHAVVDWAYLMNCADAVRPSDAVDRKDCRRVAHLPSALSGVGFVTGEDAMRRSGLQNSPPLIGTRATPLVAYILEEARVVDKGGRLGPLGSFIVAETILGALDAKVVSREVSGQGMGALDRLIAFSGTPE